MKLLISKVRLGKIYRPHGGHRRLAGTKIPIGAGLFIATLLCSALAHAGAPTDQVRATVDKVLVTVRNANPKSPSQKKDLHAQLTEIIYPRFDFNEMARRSLGSQWGRRTAVEQREFVKLFTELIGRSYTDSIESYSSQKVVYTREAEDKEYTEVDSNVVSDQQENVSLNYKLHSIDKEWRVYDLVINNISVVNNYRSQFNRVIGRSSFEELLRMLREKLSLG